MVKLKVALDTRMKTYSGIGTYTRGLIQGMKEFQDEIEFIELQGSSNIYSISEQIETTMLFRQSNASLLHVPHYNLPWIETKKSIVTVHDLIHLLFPEYFPSIPARAYANLFLKIIVPRTRHILTVSEHTKKDMIQHLQLPESKITVIPLAPDVCFTPSTSPPQVLTDQRPYFLYIGNIKEFKNTPFLLKAFSTFRKINGETIDLVLVGKNFIPTMTEALTHQPGVRWLNYVPLNDLPDLYRGATAFIFPSLYEGFGLPPLEAMACGTPVITSNRASLPEVMGDAALFIDPEQEESLVSAMIKIVTTPLLRKQMVEKGLQRASLFSWKKTAEKTLNIYKQYA